MSDEPNPSDVQGQEDIRKQLTSEFDRKLKNVTDSVNQQIQDSNTQFLVELKNTLTPTITTPVQAQESNMPEEFHDTTPEEFRKAVIEEVKNLVPGLVKEGVSKGINDYDTRNLTRSELVRQYPELADPKSGFSKLILDEYNKLGADQQKDDNHISALVYRKAAELGLKPSQFRENADDETFSLGSEGGPEVRNRKRRENQGNIDPEMEQWAELVGIDLSDKDQKEKLERFAKRKNWNKFAGSEKFTRKDIYGRK